MARGRQDVASLRIVNRWFYLTLRFLIARALQLLFRLHPVNRDAVPRSGAAIIVANHVTVFDPIWLYCVLRRPVYLVATEELFRSPFVRGLVRRFGAFPKRKAARDVFTVRNILTVIKNGDLLGLYPEGVRTWDGTNSPIIPTIARIVRRMRVPVIACRFDGGYFALPRWARHWRRIPVRVVFRPLYTRDTIPASDEQVIRDIAEAIRIRDYELEWPPLRKVFRRLPEGISRLIYRCPQCGTLESLRATLPWRHNRFECSSCFSSWKIDVFCTVTALDEEYHATGERIPLYRLYRQIKDIPFRPVRSSLLRRERGEELYLASSPHVLYRERRFPYFTPFAYGRLFLTSHRLLFRGRRGLRLQATLAEVDSVSIEPGNKLHFVVGGRLYRIVFRNASPLKWADAMEQLVGHSLMAEG